MTRWLCPSTSSLPIKSSSTTSRNKKVRKSIPLFTEDKRIRQIKIGCLVGVQWRWQRGEARGLILNKCLEANFWPTPHCLTKEANFWPIPSFQLFLDAGVRTISPKSEPAFNKRSILSLCALWLDVQTFEILLGQAVNNISRNRIFTIKPEEWGCLSSNQLEKSMHCL